MKVLSISFSGGRTSAFMTYWLLKYFNAKKVLVYANTGKAKYIKHYGVDPRTGNEIIIFVNFANTGKERRETLEFIEQCDKYFDFGLNWIEAVVDQRVGYGIRGKRVNYRTASRKGEPFEAAIKKFGLPNKNNPFCSRDLKKEAIDSFMKYIVGVKKFYTAIGIRADEPQRLNFDRAKKMNFILPLATMIRTTKSDIAKFWSLQPFDLMLKSYEGNCDACWKKAFRKLMTIAQEHAELFDWWKDMQAMYENHSGEARQKNPNIKFPIRMYRDNTTVEEILEESQFDFKFAID